jgi:multiple sugar transport system substrate-binding protein
MYNIMGLQLMGHRRDLIYLRGTTWNHSRGYGPMVATAQRFSELNPGVEITWEKRSLQDFADQPIDHLAERYDLLVIDHPWVGFASASGLLLPLDNHLSAAFLADQAAHAVGLSHRSYIVNGRQWALAIDAAAPVASWRPDLLPAEGQPTTWSGLLEMARAGKVLMPGIPTDTLMNFYMLCSTLGEDIGQEEDGVVSRRVGELALGMLRELALLIDPVFWNLNPIRVYEAMTLTDRYAYCPFAYGYSNYSRAGYARTLLDFGDIVEIEGRRARTTLGGAGLAVSAGCREREAALGYAAFLADPVCQQTLYYDSGGQPGHRSAWMDERVNALCRNYFLNTLPVLDRAFLRPCFPGYIHFQDRAGVVIRDYLRDGGDSQEVLTRLDALYRQSRRDARQ